MKKKMFSLAMIAMVCLTSCENLVDSMKHYYAGYFTISGNVEEGYTLYQDGGGIVKPSLQSIIDVAGKDGFADNERVFLALSYRTADIKPCDGGEMLVDAEVLRGECMPLHFPLSKQEADQQMITQPDSIFSVNSILHVWAYRGFINTLINANVSEKNGKHVAPGVNIVYEPDKIAANKIEFTIYYNRHTSKETDAFVDADFVSTFPIYEMRELIPGNDSVEITLHVDGANPKTFKIGRDDLTKDHYLPYDNHGIKDSSNVEMGCRF